MYESFLLPERDVVESKQPLMDAGMQHTHTKNMQGVTRQIVIKLIMSGHKGS